MLIYVLATVALLFSWRYFDGVHAHYHALVLLFTAGMAGFALTGDLFDMFVFFELMGAAAYALTGFKIEDPESVQGGLTFGVVNSLGAYLSLTGIGILYARTGQLGLPQLGTALAGPRQRSAGTGVVRADLHRLAGQGGGRAVPLLAGRRARRRAGTGVRAVLRCHGAAGLSTAWPACTGWCSTACCPTRRCTDAVLVLGIATAALGAVMCWTQRHIKRLLAYSTIAHIGLFLIGIAALSPLGLAGTGVYLAGHATVKGALFLLAGLLLSRYAQRRRTRSCTAGHATTRRPAARSCSAPSPWPACHRSARRWASR